MSCAAEKKPVRAENEEMHSGMEADNSCAASPARNSAEVRSADGKPRAALFISSLTRGGAERVMVNLAGYLKKAGWELLLVTQYQQKEEYPVPAGVRRVLSDLTPEETAAGLLARPRNLSRRLRKLERIWASFDPDLIVAFNGKNNIMAVESARKGRYPVVVFGVSEPHLEYPTFPMWHSMIRAFTRADGVILTTHRCIDEFPVKIRAHAVALPTPLSESFLTGPAPWPRERRIVSVGRLDSNKNQTMMMEAFGRAAREIPGWTLELYGDGEDREILARRAEEINRELMSWKGAEDIHPAGEIRLCGRTEDVPAAIRSASVFLLTSDIEGMPNSLLEAMSLGLACISTDCPCGGPAEVIRDGENGLLVPVRDTEALTAALEKLMRSPDLCRRLGQSAEQIRTTHAPEAAMQAWERYLLTKARPRED